MNTNQEKVWLVPMPSSEQVIKEKQVDYSVLGALMLESKRDGKLQDPFTRYIYLNRLVGDNLKEFCDSYNLTATKVKGKIRHLKTVTPKLLEVLTVTSMSGSQEVVYRIHYADIENVHFVRVPSNVLKELVTSYKSNVVKLFCILLYLLRDSKSGKYVTRFIPLSHLGQLLQCNKDTAGRYVKALEKAGFIKVFRRWETDTSNDNGNTISKNYYSISPEIADLIWRLSNTRTTDEPVISNELLFSEEYSVAYKYI